MGINVTKKPCIIISAYDVSTGKSSEGYVAFNIIKELGKCYRIILVTRKNNKSELLADETFRFFCGSVQVVGFDLPKWACWWKKGGRFYQLYAYLWQLIWPFIFVKKENIIKNVKIIHVLNFHNDSMPSLAGIFGKPLIWGPINHNEIIQSWRIKFWPFFSIAKNVLAFSMRKFLWKFDPFLRFHLKKSNIIISAGSWVDHRLNLVGSDKVIRRSQIGVNDNEFFFDKLNNKSINKITKKFVYAGRLDWIKGVDLAIEALSFLPDNCSLCVIGSGPAEKKLKNLVNLLGIESRVFFEKPLSRKELTERYREFDAFLFPSAEVAGLAWVEALACGLPIVAFSGNSEICAASNYLPGIRLAIDSGIRDINIKRYSEAMSICANSFDDPEFLSLSAISYYSWSRLIFSIKDAYDMAICR